MLNEKLLVRDQEHRMFLDCMEKFIMKMKEHEQRTQEQFERMMEILRVGHQGSLENIKKEV